jgi:hypothetical protein
MTSLDEIASPAPAVALTGNDAILVEVQNPEASFGGVVIEMPSEIPVVVDFVTRGVAEGGAEGPSAPAAGAVTSVFTRQGDVVAVTGDYSLNQIAPPIINWTLPGKLRVKSDGSFQLWNPDQSKWHTLQIKGSAGAEYITIGAGES